MMYTDNAPDYFYVIVSILALALIALISLRLFDQIPRKFRRRRNTRRLWDMIDRTDERLINVEAELRERFGDNTDVLENEQRHRFGSLRPASANVLFFKNTGVIVGIEGEQHEITMCSCERCNHEFAMRYTDQKNYCPVCGSKFTGMLHSSVRDFEKTKHE